MYPIGQALSNGAIVLACKPGVVLALKGHEFVTWILNPQGDTCSGNYHSDLLIAVEDYNTRS